MEKALLLGIDDSSTLFRHYMEELINLCIACDIEAVHTITQKLPKPKQGFYFGSGKIQEVKAYLVDNDIDLVVTLDELTPTQIRNMEEILCCKIIDRTILILDIFAKRAKTKEAMLQVELAQLKYMLPRLIGMNNSLNRQQGGIGSRGPGEKQLELDRRRIYTQISKLKKELKSVVSTRRTQRNRRNKSDIPTVAFVGYTNAGKSTMINHFVSMTNKNETKQVFEKDMLFATLETSTRLIQLENNKSFLITDTVGFLHNLPHHLVESFKSTLEEITEADLIIHVVDCSNPYYEEQIQTTNQVLQDIGVSSIRTIYAYNKIDLLDKPIYSTDTNHFSVSAKKNIFMSDLLKSIEEIIFDDYINASLLIPYSDTSVFATLKEHYNVKSYEYEDEYISVFVELPKKEYNKLEKYHIH